MRIRNRVDKGDFGTLSSVAFPLRVNSSDDTVVNASFATPASVAVPGGKQRTRFAITVRRSTRSCTNGATAVGLGTPDRNSSSLCCPKSFVSCSLGLSRIGFVSVLKG